MEGDEHNMVKCCERCGGEFLLARSVRNPDRYQYCHGCVDVIRAEQRASAPKCEACHTRRGTWKISGVLMCGRCKKQVQTNRNRQLAGFGALAFAVALESAPLSREQVLTLAQEREG